MATVALESAATSDVDSFNLPYCRPPVPENLSATSSDETTVTLRWDAVPNTDRYWADYRGGPALDWTVVATSTATTQNVGGLRCGEWAAARGGDTQGTVPVQGSQPAPAPTHCITSLYLSPDEVRMTYGKGRAEDPE